MGFTKTFINPLVLPDYPVLYAKSVERDVRPGTGWGHESMKLVSERDLLTEIYGENVNNKGAWGGQLPKGKEFFQPAANDVRATADPTVLYYENKWYLYCTGGYVYDTEDFVTWHVHEDETWLPISTPMAPTVEVFRGKFYATANSVPLHVADNPLGPWKVVGDWELPDGRKMLCGDPMIFADGDRLYFYWGLGNGGIFGAELDPEHPNKLLTFPKQLLAYDKNNSWERGGTRNENWVDGCIEGSWMFKHNGTYYLTYSAAGTSFYSYCMGAYVSDQPLGEFKLQKRNPISRSENGLVRGGGHGSVVKGPKNTIWCFYTIPVCIDHMFERRIGMDPCGIDEDGCLYAMTGCDVPQYAPGVLDHPENGNETGAVPLNLFLQNYASSSAYGHMPLYAFDEVLHTWWEPESTDTEPILESGLMSYSYVSSARIIWKDVHLDYKAGITAGAYRYVIEVQAPDSDEWKVVVDASDNQTDLTVDYRTFDEVLATKVRLRILGWPEGMIPGVINFVVFGESAAKRK